LAQPDDYVVVGNITAGTPPQQFSVAFDFFQEDLYLIALGADGASSESSSDEVGKNQYDSSASSTYQKENGSFSADGGYATGYLASDLFNLGGLSVNLTFGVADSIDDWIDELPIDGVIGISSQNSDNNIPNVLNQLAPQMTDPIFVMHTSRAKNGALNNDSFIAFGSENIPQCQQGWTHVTNITFKRDGIYGPQISSVNIEGNTTSVATNSSLVIYTDSGFVDKYVSYQVMDLLVQASGAIYNETISQYLVPCDKIAQAKNVVLHLTSGETITLIPSDFVYMDKYDVHDETVCVFDVQGGYEKYFELDMRFFNTRCVSYNSKTQQLGLAAVVSAVNDGQ
jgi:hypothetical protein